MTFRIMLTLPVIAGISGSLSVIAQPPPRLPSPVHARGSAARSAEMPPQPVQPDLARQAAYPSQPAHPGAFGDLSGPVPVETLVQYALANNPAIQAARYRARSLGARVPQAASLPDPQLLTSVFLEQIQTAAGPQDVALSLSQRFPWFGKRALRGQVAYHDATAAYARVAGEELRVIEQAKLGYYDLYFVESAIRETRRLQLRLEDVVKISQTKYETNVAGTGLESVLQAQIELSKLKVTLVQLEQARTKAQARLAGTLHLPPQTRLEAVPQVERANVAHTAELLVQLAESCQPELDALRREVSRDRSAIDLASREYWPDVTVGFNWYEMGPGGISPVANGQDACSLGIGVNLPIYRKRLDAAVREAQYKTASSRRRYAATRDQVQSEIETLYAQFQEQQQVLGILESEILPRAEQGLGLTMESYRTGTRDFQQLIDTYRTLLDYRIDFHKRVAMREQAIASLERAVGCAVTGGPTQRDAHPPGIPEAAPLPPPRPAP